MLFGETFEKQLRDDGIPSVPGVYKYHYNAYVGQNPNHAFEVWYQNWELHYCGLHFYANDFNARKPAVRELGYKGSWPGVELHNYHMGTFQWLNSTLLSLQSGNMTVADSSIVLMQHHPFRAPLGVPDFIYGWSSSQKKAIRAVLELAFPVEKYWGVIAGHWHRWFDGTAFDEWPTFRQWETAACKDTGSITLVGVSGGQIGKLQKLSTPY